MLTWSLPMSLWRRCWIWWWGTRLLGLFAGARTHWAWDPSCGTKYLTTPSGTGFKRYVEALTIWFYLRYIVELRYYGHYRDTKIWPHQRGGWIKRFSVKKITGGLSRRDEKSGRNNEVAVITGRPLGGVSLDYEPRWSFRWQDDWGFG